MFALTMSNLCNILQTHCGPTLALEIMIWIILNFHYVRKLLCKLQLFGSVTISLLFPFGMNTLLHFSKLEFPSPKTALCKVCPVSVVWFLRNSYNCERSTDDTQKTEKFQLKTSLELSFQLSWANKYKSEDRLLWLSNLA